MDVDIAALPSLDLVDRLKVPGGDVVYFILDSDGQPLYIGRTMGLYTRLGCHSVVRGSPGNGAVRVAWLACSDWREADEIESALIFSLKPPLNARGKRWKLARRQWP
jgi:hypothetical protein